MNEDEKILQEHPELEERIERSVADPATRTRRDRPKAELIDEAVRGIKEQYGDVLRRLADS